MNGTENKMGFIEELQNIVQQIKELGPLLKANTNAINENSVVTSMATPTNKGFDLAGQSLGEVTSRPKFGAVASGNAFEGALADGDGKTAMITVTGAGIFLLAKFTASTATSSNDMRLTAEIDSVDIEPCKGTSFLDIHDTFGFTTTRHLPWTNVHKYAIDGNCRLFMHPPTGITFESGFILYCENNDGANTQSTSVTTVHQVI